MLTSFFLIRCSSRSSGPSKFCRRTGYASRMDSNSCSMLAVRQFHRVSDARHRVDRHRPRLLRSFVEDLADRAGPGEHVRAARANRLEVAVEGVGQLRLHLDVADL